jgi:cytoskeletal protein RodZ
MRDDNSVLGLATIRRNRGISLQEISNSTKISVRSLEAIEQGEFKKLPGGIYDTSYIRQYANAIDFDATAILAVYSESKGAVGTGTGAQSTGSGRSSFRGFHPASLTGQ